MSTTTPVMQPTQGLELRRRIVRRLIQVFAQFILIAALLFVSAWTLDWVWAWVYLAISIGYMLIMMVTLLPSHLDVVAERAQTGTGTKNWDKWITRLLIAPSFSLYIVAGLDFRFGWTPDTGAWLHIGAAVTFLLGYMLIGWVMVTNRFFATTVRIQAERGHTVVTDGPYRFVRHPGYLSMIVSTLSMAILFGSIWALIPAAMSIALTIVRTMLEDRTLQAELPGYAAYTQQTHYRLIPGVW